MNEKVIYKNGELILSKREFQSWNRFLKKDNPAVKGFYQEGSKIVYTMVNDILAYLDKTKKTITFSHPTFSRLDGLNKIAFGETQ